MLGSLEYRYNGLGDRIQQVADGVTTTFTLDLNNPLTQVLADGQVTYLYGLDRIAQEEAGIEYYLPDGLGSARQLSDAAGGITRAASFEPFGARLEAAGPSASSYGFTGEWHDALGLIDLRARTYSPELGIFLSRDPFAGVLFSPQTQHPYAYVGANPATFGDPSGMFTPWDVLDVGSLGWSLRDFIKCPTWENAVFGMTEGRGLHEGVVRCATCSDATVISFSYAAGWGKFYRLWGVDIVITSDEVGVFGTESIGPGLEGERNPWWIPEAQADKTRVSAQVSASASVGALWGKPLMSSVRNYAGASLVEGASIAGGTIEYLESVDPRTGVPNGTIRGIAIGGGIGPPEFHAIYSRADYWGGFGY